MVFIKKKGSKIIFDKVKKQQNKKKKKEIFYITNQRILSESKNFKYFNTKKKVNSPKKKEYRLWGKCCDVKERKKSAIRSKKRRRVRETKKISWLYYITKKRGEQH